MIVFSPLFLEDYCFVFCVCFQQICLEKMDVSIFISVFSVMYTWILCTALSAPVEETHSLMSASTPTLTRGAHVRNKRCSCATFLDRECVYFCHLDIIWVNTPERVVSYGLGAPRTKRAALDSMATRSGPRCQCLSENDKTCRSFCRLDQTVRSKTSPATVILSAQGQGCTEPQCKHKLAADTSGIKSMKSSNQKRLSPAALRVTSKTFQLLQKWRGRQRRRVRTWEGESTAS